jgi:hypothetical protein
MQRSEFSYAGEKSRTDMREAFDRTAKQAVSGYCGLTGVCGIALRLARASVFSARCGADTEQKIAADAVVRYHRPSRT